MKVKELCAKYMKRKGIYLKSAEEKQRIIDVYINPKLGNRVISRLSLDAIDDFHKSMANTPYQANRCLSELSTVLTYAESVKLLPLRSNPCYLVTKFKEKPRRRYATREESITLFKQLYDNIDRYPESVLFVFLLILTGARPSEIANALPSEVKYFDDGQGCIDQEDSKRGERKIYLPVLAVDLIKRCNLQHKTLTGIKYPKSFWNRMRREAKCPDLRIYDLRHSFASAGVDAGLTLKQIGELLGHSSESSTNRYTHLMHHTALRSVTAVQQVMTS